MTVTVVDNLPAGQPSYLLAATNGKGYSVRVRTKHGTSPGPWSAPTPVVTPTSGAPAPVVPTLPPPVSGNKIVATHYFVPYPLSFRGTAGGQIYDDTGQFYDNNYLALTGTNSGAWGAFLRDRPPLAPVLPAGDYPFNDANVYKAFVEDQKIEIGRMKSAGINATFIDLLSYDNFNDRNWKLVRAHMDAAAAVGGFQVFPMIDMSGPLGTNCSVQTAVNALVDLYSHSAMGKMNGVKTFVPFTPETRDQAFWNAVDSGLATAGVNSYQWVWCVQQWNVATWTARAKTYGMSAWGDRNPAAADATANRGNEVHAAGKAWVQTNAIQDIRYATGMIFDEGYGSGTLRRFFQSCRDTNAEGTQLITWNDYSESTQFSASRNNGDSWLRIIRFYIDWFVSGTKPTPTTDVVAVIHRKHHTDATIQGGRTKPSLRGGSTPTANFVEVLTLLKAAGQVSLQVGGGAVQTFSAPAGENVQTYAISTSSSGAPVATLSRNGSTVLSVTSRNPITTSPVQADFAYYVTHAEA